MVRMRLRDRKRTQYAAAPDGYAKWSGSARAASVSAAITILPDAVIDMPSA